MSVTVRPHCQLSYLFLVLASEVAAKNMENGMSYTNHGMGTDNLLPVVDSCVDYKSY